MTHLSLLYNVTVVDSSAKPEVFDGDLSEGGKIRTPQVWRGEGVTTPAT
jgi:hypothetical protein